MRRNACQRACPASRTDLKPHRHMGDDDILHTRQTGVNIFALINNDDRMAGMYVRR